MAAYFSLSFLVKKNPKLLILSYFQLNAEVLQTPENKEMVERLEEDDSLVADSDQRRGPLYSSLLSSECK